MKQIEWIVYQGVKKGTNPLDIRDQLMEKAGMIKKKARFTARDQAGSMLGQKTGHRRHTTMAPRNSNGALHKISGCVTRLIIRKATY